MGVTGVKETLDQNGIDGIKAVTTGKGDAGINGDGINGTTGAKGDTGSNGIGANGYYWSEGMDQMC
jgi:hypothetical protein